METLIASIGQKSITTPFENLSRLHEREATRYTAVAELDSDVIIDRIRLVNDKIWGVDRGPLKISKYDVTKCSINPVFDLKLNRVESRPWQRGIIDIAQLPDGLLAVVTRHRLGLRKPGTRLDRL